MDGTDDGGLVLLLLENVGQELLDDLLPGEMSQQSKADRDMPFDTLRERPGHQSEPEAFRLPGWMNVLWAVSGSFHYHK